MERNTFFSSELPNSSRLTRDPTKSLSSSRRFDRVGVEAPYSAFGVWVGIVAVLNESSSSQSIKESALSFGGDRGARKMFLRDSSSFCAGVNAVFGRVHPKRWTRPSDITMRLCISLRKRTNTVENDRMSELNGAGETRKLTRHSSPWQHQKLAVPSSASHEILFHPSL